MFDIWYYRWQLSLYFTTIIHIIHWYLLLIIILLFTLWTALPIQQITNTVATVNVRSLMLCITFIIIVIGCLYIFHFKHWQWVVSLQVDFIHTTTFWITINICERSSRVSLNSGQTLTVSKQRFIIVIITSCFHFIINKLY